MNNFDKFFPKRSCHCSNYNEVYDECFNQQPYCQNKPCCCKIPGPRGPKGDPGVGTIIRGSYNSLEELIANHPIGDEKDGYLVNGDLYVWNETVNEWQKVGNLSGPTGPKGDPGTSGPFQSSYLEAVGTTQTRISGESFVFDTDEAYIDVVGNDITINTEGDTFTLNKAGLYQIEWSMNISSANTQPVVAIVENQQPASALANTNTTGNFSSGALINVRENQIPYAVSLRNYTDTITISNVGLYENIAISIRILRFADGA